MLSDLNFSFILNSLANSFLRYSFSFSLYLNYLLIEFIFFTDALRREINDSDRSSKFKGSLIYACFFFKGFALFKQNTDFSPLSQNIDLNYGNISCLLLKNSLKYFISLQRLLKLFSFSILIEFILLYSTLEFTSFNGGF